MKTMMKSKKGAKGVKDKSHAKLNVAVMRKIPVGRIHAAAYNPRKNLVPADPEYQKLKRSITEFGLVDPLVWNERSGNLVGGHQRLKVLVNEFQVREVPVSVVNLGPAAEKALNLALNKITGEWDDLALADVLGGLLEEESIDVGLSGFDEAEIKAALVRTHLEREQQRMTLEREEQLRREAVARRAADARAARAESERLEMAQRAAERRLRMERNARLRAEQRAFESRRDETSRVAKGRRAESGRDRRREPAAMRER